EVILEAGEELVADVGWVAQHDVEALGPAGPVEGDRRQLRIPHDAVAMPDVAVEARQVAAVRRGLEPERAPGDLHGHGAPVDAEQAPERPLAGFERLPLPAAQAGEHTL